MPNAVLLVWDMASGRDGEDGSDGYMGYVRFLQRRGLWGTTLGASKSDDFNSHWPMLPTYRKMLKRFHESADTRHLTKADIVRITTGLEFA